jgi:DNA-binding NarL/FixJ family response regulator
LSPIRVFLLIGNRLLREALTRLLKKRSDMLVVGQASQEKATPELLIESDCAVLTLDFADPQWLPNQFFDDHPNPLAQKFRALLVGMETDQQQFLGAVRAGASGYMLKDASAGDVVAAIRATVKGEAVCPPCLCATLFQCVSQ